MRDLIYGICKGYEAAILATKLNDVSSPSCISSP